MPIAPNNLSAAIELASQQYFRLLILAGLPKVGKTAALQRTAAQRQCGIINVNLELSQRMLEMTRNQRARHAERLLREIISETSGDIVLLDNLEILFDPELELEPLRLLQLSSRNRTLVVSWNGSFDDDTLTYAEPGHPEFQQVKHPDALVFCLTTQRSAAG